MDFSDIYSHRFALEILESVPQMKALWVEIQEAISTISDADIENRHRVIQNKQSTKSLSKAINYLIDSRLTDLGWTDQSGIFGTPEYTEGKETTWTLDFSKSVVLKDGKKSGVALEVGFNHAEAAAWNLTKPVLAAEINDVRVQTNIGEGVGVVIVASPELKKNGAFDGAIGDYQRYLKTLKAMRSQLTVPILLLGLAAPKSFRVQATAQKDSPYKIGEIVPI